MNAEIIWLQWQALGNDVPIEVCELLAELMPHFSTCDLAVKDNGWRASLTSRTTVWIVMKGSVMPLDEEGVTRLALFCWRLHSVNDAGSERFALCEAAKWWWHPIVQRCHAEGRALLNAEALYLLFLSLMPHPVPLPMCRLIIEWSDRGELHVSPDGQCWSRHNDDKSRALVLGGRVVVDHCDADMYARLKAIPGTLGEYLGQIKARQHGDLTEGWDLNESGGKDHVARSE